jgi:phosphohistidine phosphatase SixA
MKYSTIVNSNSLREFYSKAALVALVVSGCATARPDPPPPDPAPGTTTVYFVRHAEKMMMSDNDPDPDISNAGRARAKALAERLKTAGISHIIATEFKRTQQTAAPLASALGLSIDVVPVGHVGDNEALAREILAHPGDKVLVVGHSLTIAPVIELLGGPHLPNLCENEYSNLFILYLPPEGAKPQLIRQHYGPGDPMATVRCGS